jgi:hypothetical protein
LCNNESVVRGAVLLLFLGGVSYVEKDENIITP